MPRFPLIGGLLLALVGLAACGVMLYPPANAASGPAMAHSVLLRFSRFDLADPVTALVAASLAASLLGLIFHADQKSLGLVLLVIVLCVRSFWVDSSTRVAPGAGDAGTPVAGFIVGLLCAIVLLLGGAYPRGLRAHGWAFASGIAALALISLFLLKHLYSSDQPGNVGTPISFASYTRLQSTLSTTRFAQAAAIWGAAAAFASLLIGIALQGPRAALKP